MTVPGMVQSNLEGEEIAARVTLGDDDELFITPTRTLIYRASGLLSDESVDEYPHNADRLTLTEKRRKTKFTYEYALEGERSFTIPATRTEDVLHPVLAGVLNGNGITDPGETVVQTFRFSEVTVIVTSDRLVKHIGAAVWDTDFEKYHYDDVTNLSFEEGSVATQVVLETDGRQQRLKIPNDQVDEVRERIKRALCSYYDVGSIGELNALLEPEEDEREASTSTVDFGPGVDPLDANPPVLEETESTQTEAGEAATTTDMQAPTGSPDGRAATGGLTEPTSASSDQQVQSSPAAGTPVRQVDANRKERPGTEPASQETDAILERLDALEAVIEAQNDQIEAQQATIEQLIAELRQGR